MLPYPERYKMNVPNSGKNGEKSIYANTVPGYYDFDSLIGQLNALRRAGLIYPAKVRIVQKPIKPTLNLISISGVCCGRQGPYYCKQCGWHLSWRKFEARPTQKWQKSKIPNICTLHYNILLKNEEKFKDDTRAYNRYLVEQREWERKVNDINISNSGKNRDTLRDKLHKYHDNTIGIDKDNEYVITLLKHFTEISGYDSAILYGPDFCKELAQICYNHKNGAYIFENVDWNKIK